MGRCRSEKVNRRSLTACIGIILLAYFASAQGTHDYESVAALWHHGLSATRLAGYKNSERLLVSDIWSGTPGQNAIIKYSFKIKVNVWGRQFTTSSQAADKKSRETLSVTLFKTTNRREMSAHFEHIVYEKGEVKLRFCGVTRLPRI